MIGVGIGLPVVSRAGAATPSYLLDDTFTDTNGTLLSSHTPEQGGTWSFMHLSELDIQGNKAKGKTFVANFAYAIAPGAANVTMSADVSGGSDIGVIANVTDYQNFWMAWNSGGNLILYERTGGSFISRASVVGESIRPGLTTSGDTIYLLDNGTQVASYTGSPRNHKSSTSVGLMVFSSSGGSFDNARAV